MQMWIRSLGWEHPLEEGMANQCSILAWRIPWTQDPGRLQSMGSQRIRHDQATKLNHCSVHLKLTHCYKLMLCVCVCLCVCAHMLNCVQLFVTPQIVARQAPLSMEFSRQEYWSELPFSTPEDLPNPSKKKSVQWLKQQADYFIRTYWMDIRMLCGREME